MVSVDQNLLKIDIVIPSIRMDKERLSSILDINIPSNVELTYYVVIDNPSLKSKSFVHNGRSVNLIVNTENLGASLSRNVGLDASRGEYILFLDDDVVPDADILYAYISAIEKEPDASGYVGPTKFPDPINSFTSGIRASGMLTFFNLPLMREFVPWGTTSNIMIQKSKVKNIRFLSIFPKHGGGEDIDFCLNIVKDNKKLFKTVPDALVRHDWWGNGKRSYKRFFRWAFGDSRLLTLHPEYRYYEVPNVIETLVIGLPVLIGISLIDLLPLYSVGIWAGLVVLCEFIVNRFRVKMMQPNSSFRDIIEATIIKLSNQLGRFIGPICRGERPKFCARFDFFLNRESIPFEHRTSKPKFILFMISIFITYLLTSSNSGQVFDIFTMFNGSM